MKGAHGSVGVVTWVSVARTTVPLPLARVVALSFVVPRQLYAVFSQYRTAGRTTVLVVQQGWQYNGARIATVLIGLHGVAWDTPLGSVGVVFICAGVP